MAAGRSTADELAGVFARVSGLLLTTETVNTALKLLTSLARQVVPGAAGSGITLLDERGERVTAAATDAVVERADALQYRLGRGPCLTSWQDHVVVRVDDLTRDERWPDWSRPAAGLGLRAVLCAPLVAGARSLGALKVYAREPDVHGSREQQVLTLFASQAAVLLANARTARDAERISDRLRDSLREREVISVAKGIVMARDGVDERAAFLALTDAARQQGSTLRQAAERLAQSTVRRRR
ncbi:GAF and ANTAR domain-containing protein [Saccharothrix yanglingensis]|uniref:Transcription antitermination regulator n=1 Tax=Saccharothrix yanglingensis TaxID=659496 RepID=A0ABU0WVC9_9PSEU|nr:GAF and ANTAR domain-containing protein [Saccharothrix yanglingensis]MDQ2583776.1 transcription antitermination regulator [Saccharothrix yanglingensis]